MDCSHFCSSSWSSALCPMAIFFSLSLRRAFLSLCVVRGGGVPHGISVWAALHSFSQLNQTAHSTPPVSDQGRQPQQQAAPGDVRQV